MTETDDDLVPVSVRLGEVVPPEDPEDWRRPLTWIAALGMLAAPLVTLAWFIVASPTDGGRATPLTYLVAAALASGAAATGATQIGRARAGTATLGSGLFASLGVIVLGVVMAGERQVEAASPTLAHAFAASVSGLAGVAAAAVAAALVGGNPSRPIRFGLALAVGVPVALGVVVVTRAF